jgi:hypothetical protein
LKIDIACGENKHTGCIGIDVRALPGVDIVHDLESFPWPIPSGTVAEAIASHYIEHIKPWLSIAFMNEVWRVLVPGGKFTAITPYAGSPAYWQDPTHCNGWTEITFQYFDPRYHLFRIYKPRPWRICGGYPRRQNPFGFLEVVMEKQQ